ncbi:MAG: HAD-IA family hydrolase [Paracoccaceae bacterium]|nr:HAD-IA family hydrolase [Paracoccaceae bacterium]
MTAGLPARWHRVYSIASLAADKYTAARVRFLFLNSLDGMLVSSEVNLKEPDPKTYRAFLRKFELNAEDCLVVEDDPANAAGAEKVGMADFVTKPSRQRAVTLPALVNCRQDYPVTLRSLIPLRATAQIGRHGR